jgi:ABC-2 type transport system permease protein
MTDTTMQTGTPGAMPAARPRPKARRAANPLRDTLLVFRRAIGISVRNPVWLVMGAAQPLLYIFLFGPLLTKFAGMPGFPPGNAWQVFVPAILVLLGLFGGAFAGFGLISEWRDGVIDRMRVTPMSRFALLFGRVLRDVAVLVVQAVLLVLAGVLMGLRAPVAGVIVGIIIVAVMGVTMSAAGYAVALKVKSEDALAPLVNGIMVPLMLLAGVMLPITKGLAPDWLYYLSRVNPVVYVVEGSRAAFQGQFASGHFWIGIAVAAALAAVGVTVASRTFTRMSR